MASRTEPLAEPRYLLGLPSFDEQAFVEWYPDLLRQDLGTGTVVGCAGNLGRFTCEPVYEITGVDLRELEGVIGPSDGFVFFEYPRVRGVLTGSVLQAIAVDEVLNPPKAPLEERLWCNEESELSTRSDYDALGPLYQSEPFVNRSSISQGLDDGVITIVSPVLVRSLIAEVCAHGWPARFQQRHSFFVCDERGSCPNTEPMAPLDDDPRVVSGTEYSQGDEVVIDFGGHCRDNGVISIELSRRIELVEFGSFEKTPETNYYITVQLDAVSDVHDVAISIPDTAPAGRYLMLALCSGRDGLGRRLRTAIDVDGTPLAPFAQAPGVEQIEGRKLTLTIDAASMDSWAGVAVQARKRTDPASYVYRAEHGRAWPDQTRATITLPLALPAAEYRVRGPEGSQEAIITVE